MPLTDNPSHERIRDLNDAFRKSLDVKVGRIVLTAGVNALPDAARVMAVRQVKTFDAFDDGNNPYGEHDFGSFELAHERFFWKIDYYDANLQFGSDDPADPAKTTRVLTLMLASEY